MLNITYVLLSSTFGMHQYTADLANRVAQEAGIRGQASDTRSPAANTARLVTTTTLPRDRYSPTVQIETPITTHGTGFARAGFDIVAYHRTLSAISHFPSAIVHFTGVHLWNLSLVHALRRQGMPVIHTLHDLDPHHGVRHGGLIRLWNRLIIASGCHLLVHGRRYRDQLLAEGIPAGRITYVPLLHGFLSAERPWPPAEAEAKVKVKDELGELDTRAARDNPDLPLSLNLDLNLSLGLNALFFGRVEAYKGVDMLLRAWKELQDKKVTTGEAGKGASRHTVGQLIIAGPLAKGLILPLLPPATDLRNRRIADDEAEELFRSAAVLVLPYRDATQSALIAATYAFGAPVIVTDAGALSEYVVRGETGWVVPAGDANALVAALGEALANPDRLRRMGAAGQAWFEAQRQEEQKTLTRMYTSLLLSEPGSARNKRANRGGV